MSAHSAAASLAPCMLGGRPPAMVAREALRGRNYQALWRMRRVYPRPIDSARRYFLGWGDYPYACPLRTPLGIVAPTLFTLHDMWTVNEVFCRRDYGDDRSARTVVDIGSNIGISALYFLTRNRECRVWLYEPVPRNIERLRANLAGYEDRYTAQESAVAPAAGRVSFGVEDSGRYGGIGVQTGRTIEVRTTGINEALGEVLESIPAIDVLKIDTEGTELEILGAVRPELLRKVRTAYLEVEQRPACAPEPFDAAFRNQTWVLRNRALNA
jgi:FkbM family methyltransferase